MTNPAIVSDQDWRVLQQHWKDFEKTMFDPQGDFDREMHRVVSLVNLLPGVVSVFCCASHPEDQEPANTLTLMLACRDQQGHDNVSEMYRRIWEGHDALIKGQNGEHYNRHLRWELSLLRKRLPAPPFTYYHPLVLRCHNIQSNDMRREVIALLEMVLCGLALGFRRY